MQKYICPCGYVYDPEKGDPEHGIAPGTKWEDVPEDWLCPICGEFNAEDECACKNCKSYILKKVEF